MANHLKMAEIHAILTLRARGWSFRRIARELGVHRETVARYVGRAAACTGADPPKPANAPTGPAPPKPAKAPPRALDGSSVSGLTPDALLVLPAAGRAGPPSGCEPYRSVILAKLDAGLSAVRIHQDLTAEHGAALSYHAVRRFVGKLRSTSPLPFRRMECQPGDEAQVDFGTAAPVISPDGRPAVPAVKSKRRRTHLFRIVLSHSRKVYSEAVYRQTTDDFIRCLENTLLTGKMPILPAAACPRRW